MRAHIALTQPSWQASRAISSPRRNYLRKVWKRCLELEDHSRRRCRAQCIRRHRPRPVETLLLRAHYSSDASQLGETWVVPLTLARALSNLANLVRLQGEFERASALNDECLAMFRAAGDNTGVAWMLNYLGDVAKGASDSPPLARFTSRVSRRFASCGTAGVLRARSPIWRVSARSGRLVRQEVFTAKVSRCLETWAISAASPECSNASQRAQRHNPKPSRRCAWQERPPHCASK